MSRRFQPQFRLLHLVVLMSLTCMVLAWVADLRQRRERQAQAMRLVQLQGGSVDAIVISPWREWLAGGPVDQQLTVRFMALHKDAWGPYGPQGQIVKLNQWHPDRFPELHQALAELPGITALSFDHSRMRGYTADLIVASPRITQLGLSETGIRSADLAVLSRVPHLTELSLRRTSTADEGLQHVAQLADLEWLDLSSTDVTDDGMPQLAGLTKLKTLRLNNTHLTDEGLQHLSSLRSLEEFDLGMTLVSEQSLPLLASLQIRTRLNVPGEWSWEAVEALRKASPATCQVSNTPYFIKDRADAKARRRGTGK